LPDFQVRKRRLSVRKRLPCKAVQTPRQLTRRAEQTEKRYGGAFASEKMKITPSLSLDRHDVSRKGARARDHLLVTGVNPVSEFLDDLLNYDRVPIGR
jgi:hypothetical protein